MSRGIIDKNKRLMGMKAVTLKPKIAENKLKAFNMGTMNPKLAMSKKDKEEKRRKEDEAATADVYQDFIESFEDEAATADVYQDFIESFEESKKKAMSWVRGGTVQVKEEGRVTTTAANKLYVPKSRFSNRDEKPEPPPEEPKLVQRHVAKKKGEEKKKSNLEIFKEELKLIQTERQERHRVKKIMREAAGDTAVDPVEEEPDESPFMPAIKGERFFAPVQVSLRELWRARAIARLKTERLPFMPAIKAYVADPMDEATSTNIYVGNLNPKMTEQQLCEVFGKYGPLASVKIMWPRSEEEKQRGRNCGFVAFMTRKDGERATEAIKGTDVMGYEMKLGWGKPVPIPPHPVYIPPALAEMTQPPPPSGLPFNAQPMSDHEFRKYMRVQPSHGHNKTLANAVVKVVVPTERSILSLIHRTVEFVVREGPLFEAMIMNREMNNPMFRFLFENQIPAHTYYRWKLFSILQGESTTQWRSEPFRMFKGGSIWRPPPVNPYSQGMPDNLVGKEDVVGGGAAEVGKVEDQKKGELTDTQRDRLEDMLRDLTPEKPKIGEAMVWCLDHANAAEEVVQCVTESLSIVETPLPKKIARIYLVSDILFNCSAKVANASWFRKCFQQTLEEICQQLHDTYASIDGRLKAEQFKQRIMTCFRAWEDWTVYPNDYLIRLQNLFLGLLPKAPEELLDGEPADVDGEVLMDEAPTDDIFAGEPLAVDGEPMLDGKELDESVEDVDGIALSEPPPPPNTHKFTKSKWETVDQAELESQAQAVSKWDLFEHKASDDFNLDGSPMEEDPISSPPPSQDLTPRRTETTKVMTEERRAKLREIEVKVMKYQDELESGKKSRKSGMSMSEQIEKYRQKLLLKEEKKSEKEKEKEDRRRSTRDKGHGSGSDDSEPEPAPHVTHNLARLKAQYAESPRVRSRSRSPRNSPYVRSGSPRSIDRRDRNKRPVRRSRSRSRSPLVSYGRSPRSPIRHKHKHKKKH